MDQQKSKPGESVPLDQAFRERLRSVKSASERRTIAGMVRELSKLPVEQSRAAIETSAAIAGVSFRASIEFLRSVPEAAKVLISEDLRSWGEIGRRVAMNDGDSAILFFATGVAHLSTLPQSALSVLFEICKRQMTLSTTVATETFAQAPGLANSTTDDGLVTAIFEVASEIARRSAKHSFEFLNASRAMIDSLKRFGSDASVVTIASVELASRFAFRAGGIAADAWSALPEAIGQSNLLDALKLIRRTGDFLERGGGAALHVLTAGGAVIRAIPEAFDAWVDLLWTIAERGNAALVAFVRASPPLFLSFARDKNRTRAIELAARIVAVTHEVAKTDVEAALACFRSAPRALRSVTLEQFESWARDGLSQERDDARARRSYFALETRRSNEALHTDAGGLTLERVQHTLQLYVEALTGRTVEIAPLAAVPDEARINDGRTIHLPSVIDQFHDEALDFRLYKVLAAHAAGQIEFGTHEIESRDLHLAYRAISEAFAEENLDARDAFALDGYINDRAKGERSLPVEEEERRASLATKSFPSNSDYRAVLSLFPLPGLATRVFGTLENGRIDRRLRATYRGLARDLELTREHLRENRPRIVELPVSLVPFELLFQVTLCGGALDDARQFYGQIVSELETIVADYLCSPNAKVGDTLMATSRVYSMFQSLAEDQVQQQIDSRTSEAESGESGAPTESDESKRTPESRQQERDVRELFSAWNSMETSDEAEQLDGAERWMHAEMPEQGLEEGEIAFNYDEWDRELTDHRVGWCRVIEKRVKEGDRSFVEQTRERHRGIISSIRYQFQLMKPENLIRIPNEVDGDDYDLNAVIDFVIDRRADGRQSERLYTKRLRKRRDVTVSFLLDQSSSTARTIGRHPLQPYTHPGRRIIEIEKEGLVLMSEALEAVGDVYSINGFTSEGRRNVKFFVIKDFDERYSEEVESRIGGISYQNNTRLGAAIRHAAMRLEKQEARTRLLIVLSDGRPYDHDYGDARYAREDTREALRQAKNKGITPFCITIDRESEAELKDLYGEIGYTIIDDVMSLPERMPGIYRRLTT